MATEKEIAWAAGLFEGEGSIGLYPIKQKKGQYYRSLVVGMTDEDVVRRFHAIVGVGNVRHCKPPQTKPHWSDQWRWETGRIRAIQQVLEMFMPYLGDRRRGAAERMLATPGLGVHGGHGIDRDHCVRNHLLQGDNVYLYRGRRHCRECQRIRGREYARKRAALANAI